MKHLTRAIVLLLILSILPLPGQAAEATADSESIIYLDDGSYFTVNTVSMDARTNSSKSGAKEYTYYNANGVAKWKATIRASFLYTGASSICTDCTLSVEIYDDNWQEVSRSTRKSGTTAYADLIMEQKILGITYKEESLTLSLHCDNNGNLS